MKFASNKNAKVNPINELDMCVNFGIYSFNYGKQFHIRNANFDSFQGGCSTNSANMNLY